MPQNTNLNSSPYFDDFEELKNYQRVLFKPGLPVQSRELTTLQSILQNQVEKFGKHFFKEGSVVIPGQIAYDNEYTCVQIDDSHLGIPVSIYLENLKNKKIKGETSGVTAKIESYITNRESVRGSYTLYIKYQSSSDSDFSRKTFADGENLLLEEDRIILFLVLDLVLVLQQHWFQTQLQQVLRLRLQLVYILLGDSLSMFLILQ